MPVMSAEPIMRAEKGFFWAQNREPMTMFDPVSCAWRTMGST